MRTSFCRTLVHGFWVSKTSKVHVWGGGRGLRPQTERATLSSYFSHCWLALWLSKSAGGEKPGQRRGERISCAPLYFKRRLIESPCVCTMVPIQISPQMHHISCSQIINCVCVCVFGGLSVVLSCCPTPSFWSCPIPCLQLLGTQQH